VKVIVNSRNFGHLRSPVHALYQTSGDAVILLLSDLQDPPELLNEMLVEWQNGTPVVLGIKNTSEESGLMFAIRTAYYRTVAQLASVDVFEHFTGSASMIVRSSTSCGPGLTTPILIFGE